VIQGGEILVILLVALVVFGPDRLPELARKLGRWTSELRNAARELRAGLEAEVKEVKEVTSEFQAGAREVRRSMGTAAREVKTTLDDTAQIAKKADPSKHVWNGPKPLSGPTPEDAMADLKRLEMGDELDEGDKVEEGEEPAAASE
jgi:Tat protein translocase TatB subunit